MTLRVTAAFFVLVLGSNTAFAESGRNMQQIFEDILDQVNRYTHFTIFDNVNVTIDGQGVVTLSGHVTMPYKSAELAERVASVDGVAGVDNKIAALRFSLSDNELRYRIVRSIYGNSSLWQYGIGAVPSIHIVVNWGHVTLAGVVASQVDRRLTESLARQSLALSVTNHLQTDEEMRREIERLR